MSHIAFSTTFNSAWLNLRKC